ncbi:MAG: hypothetical protein KDB69_05935 [Acidimicrobiia bacterium]|nr:hypothetical protein [Acidimicrobiia bacterium]
MSFWDRFLEEMRSLGETLVEWAILIIIALAVLVVGRWLLQWLRKGVEKFLALPWLNPLWDRSGVAKALEPTTQTPASILASILYAYLMVMLWLVIVRILRITTIEVLLTRLLAWIPIVLLAGAVVLIAAAIANWTADLVQPFAADKGVGWLTVAVRVGIILFGALFALDLLRIQFAEDLVKIVTFAAGAAFAIAFGIGGIDTAKQWWAKYASPGANKTGGGAPSAPQGHTPAGQSDNS